MQILSEQLDRLSMCQCSWERIFISQSAKGHLESSAKIDVGICLCVCFSSLRVQRVLQDIDQKERKKEEEEKTPSIALMLTVMFLFGKYAEQEERDRLPIRMT